MTSGIDPYEVMRCHNRVSEFVAPHTTDIDENNPLLAQLNNTGRSIDLFFREGTLDYTYSVRNIVMIGKALECMDEIPIVAPDESDISASGKQKYAKKLLKDKNLWETLYEIEIAQDCHSAGLKTRLVHEGEQSGPDIYVNCDNVRIDIECKRRRTYDSNEDMDDLYNIMRERINNGIDIGEDSYFIELTSDGPLEEHAIDDLVDLAVHVINNRASEATKEVDGIEYKVILRDYYTGTREMDISKQDVERWFNNNIVSPHTVQAFLSPFDEGNISPGSFVRTLFKFTEHGTTISKCGAVFDFTFPKIDEEYYNRLVNNTLQSGRDDLSGRSPAVLFMHLPAHETEDMTRYNVSDLDDNPIPQIKRFEQRIEGQLENSNSMNAVVLNTTYFHVDDNGAHIERGYKSFMNPSPSVELPDKFQKFISGEFFSSQ